MRTLLTFGSSAPSCQVRRRAWSAFSLVEVVIALGIVSFAVVSILGLVSVSLNTGRRASDDTEVAMLAKAVFSDYLSTAFTNLQNQSVYFDGNGVVLPGKDKAYYECSITLLQPTPDLRSVLMRFKWPVTATPQPVNEQVFFTSVAAY